MDENPITNEGKQIAISLLFCFLTTLKLTFFGLSVFFNHNISHNSVYVMFGLSLLFGNFFLVQGIICKSSAQMLLYPIIYAYTFTINFLNPGNTAGVYLTFKLVQVGVLAFRGIVLCCVFKKFKLEFAWYHFKQLGLLPRIIGKFYF